MNKCFRCGKEFPNSFEIYDLCVCDFDDENDYVNALSHAYPVCEECKEEAIHMFDKFMEEEINGEG